MTARTLSLLTLTAVLLAGCESTPHYNRTQVVLLGTPQPKRAPETVKLYQTKAEVPGPYDVIQLMSVQGGVGDEAAFIKAFLYHAADVGADAVILYRGNEVGGYEGGGVIWGKGGGFGSAGHLSQSGSYRGEAIHLK